MVPSVTAFCNLQCCLTHALVLALPDLDAPYEVVCDACGCGLRAVILQNEQPVAFHSYKLNDADAVQTTLTGLQSQARPAPRLGRPSVRNPDDIDVLGRNGKAASETAEKKKKQSKPAKKASTMSSKRKKKLDSVTLEQQSQSLCANSRR